MGVCVCMCHNNLKRGREKRKISVRADRKSGHNIKNRKDIEVLNDVSTIKHGQYVTRSRKEEGMEEEKKK